VVRMKNDTTSCACIIYIVSYLFHFVVVVVEIRSNASPENRCRYRVMDDFNGLTVDDIIAVFSDSWIVYIPFFEIDVDVVVPIFDESVEPTRT
jgi:hypothetical protein